MHTNSRTRAVVDTIDDRWPPSPLAANISKLLQGLMKGIAINNEQPREPKLKIFATVVSLRAQIMSIVMIVIAVIVTSTM